MPKDIRQFQCKLVSWYKNHKRNFPWRNTEDAYKMLVAEMLLQQTDAPKVASVYNVFFVKYPAVELLAMADIRELSQMLAPLGLYYRAPRLIMIAKRIVANYNGNIPASEKELLKLPGVGKYIARAVCISAFRQKIGVLDTNVLRILERCFGIHSTLRRAREDQALWDLVDRMVPPSTIAQPAEWNWALLDYAALVCTYRKPKCDHCSLSTNPKREVPNGQIEGLQFCRYRL